MYKLKALLKNPHFWIILILTILLIFIYSLWPWTEWKMSQGWLKSISWLSFLFNLALFELQYHLVGSLLLIPIIYASIVFKVWGGVITYSIALIGMLPLLKVLWFNITALLTNVSLLLLPVAIVIVATIELELRRKDRQILIEREKEQRIYLSKVLEIEERERQRLAEMLHDDTVQTLLATASYAEFIETDKSNNVNEIKEKAHLIKVEIRDTVADLRKIIIGLRPGILDTMGLVPALKWLIERKRNEQNISISLIAESQEMDCSPNIKEIIFRIVQEALQNITKHSRATKVTISLKVKGNSLLLKIKDNGIGFIPPSKYSDLVNQEKIGLVGINQRVRNLGGHFQIESELGKGASLSIEIPFKSSQNHI